MFNLLMLKFPPWLAEREQTASKEDDDGWMSDIVSHVVFTPTLFWSAGNRKMCHLDILASYRSPIPLDIRVMESSLLGICCATIGTTD